MVIAERRERTAMLAERLRAERRVAGRTRTSRDAVAARVRQYEQKHGMSSDELLAGVSRGEIAETAEVSRWLIEYDLLRRVRGR